MLLIEIIKEILRLFLEMAPYIMLGLIFVGVLHLLFSKDQIIKHVGNNTIGSVLKAAVLGVPLPLCSCGVIPTSVYMAKNGASKGSVVSFLISTPQTGVDSMVATFGMMGWLFGLFRPIAAFAMGLIGGTIVRFLDKSETQTSSKQIASTRDNVYIELASSQINKSVNSIRYEASGEESVYNEQGSRIAKRNLFKGKSPLIHLFQSGKRMYHYAFVEFLDDISVQFIIGLIISGVIAYLVPNSFFEDSSINSGIFGMLIMIVVGIPMYVCATASIPIAVTLMIKGFSPGVAFVFLVVGPVTNAASFTIIMNVLGKKLSLIYLIIVSIFAIIFGYMLDGIIEIFDINVLSHIQHLHDHSTVGGLWFQYSIGVVFFIMLAMSLYRKLLPSKLKSFINNLFQFDRVENVKEGIPFDPPFSKHQRDKVEMELKYSGEQGEMNLKYEDGSMYKVKIEGMTCNHCVMNVRQAITAVEGVESVDVILSDKAAYIKGKFNFDELKKNVEAVGYRIV